MWLTQRIDSARRSVGRFVDWLVSTKQVLLIIGLALLALSVTTLANPDLQDLPGQQLIAAFSALGAGSALWAGLTGTSRLARQSIGAVLCVCASMRAVAFAIRNAREVDSFLDWCLRANPVATNILVAYLGFIVWGRAHHPEHVQNGRRERDQEERDQGGNGDGHHGRRRLRRVRGRSPAGRGPAHHDLAGSLLLHVGHRSGGRGRPATGPGQ